MSATTEDRAGKGAALAESPPAPRAPWSPTPAARASLWLHGLAAGAAALRPEAWGELAALLAANHAVLACGMHPRGTLLGPNMSRLPPGCGGAVALTFDDGPDPEGTPRVLDLLDAHGARATFFLIGQRAARHPALVREVLRRGHAVGNHTHRHSAAFACLGPFAQRREVAAAQRAIADAGGVAPRLFRAPMGLRNPFLDPVLAAEGLALVSWTRRGRDAVSGDAARVLARLQKGLAGRDILLLHDGGSRRDAGGRPVALAVLPRLLEGIAARGLAAIPVPEPPPPSAAEAPAAAAARPAPAART